MGTQKIPVRDLGWCLCNYLGMVKVWKICMYIRGFKIQRFCVQVDKYLNTVYRLKIPLKVHLFLFIIFFFVYTSYSVHRLYSEIFDLGG